MSTHHGRRCDHAASRSGEARRTARAILEGGCLQLRPLTRIRSHTSMRSLRGECAFRPGGRFPPPHIMLKIRVASLVSVLVLGAGVLGPAPAAGQAAAASTGAEAPADLAAHRALLDRYCVTCHNENVAAGRGAAASPLVAQLRAVGLSLDTLDLADVGGHADAWERVVRKLRGGVMPPAGRPRPDDAALDGFLDWLEGELDRAWAVNRDPGRPATFHRLNRTEYRNAVRDLLARRARRRRLPPGRRFELRLRQHRRRPEDVAVADGALSGRRPHHQPARGGQPAPRRLRRHLRGGSGPAAARPGRRAALRHPRRPLHRAPVFAGRRLRRPHRADGHAAAPREPRPRGDRRRRAREALHPRSPAGRGARQPVRAGVDHRLPPAPRGRAPRARGHLLQAAVGPRRAGSRAVPEPPGGRQHRRPRGAAAVRAQRHHHRPLRRGRRRRHPVPRPHLHLPPPPMRPASRRAPAASCRRWPAAPTAAP